MYKPSKIILEKYADLLVNFALNEKKGIKKNDVVYIFIHESAKPLLSELRKAILKAGGNMIIDYRPDEDDHQSDEPGVYNFGTDFYDLASDNQLEFFPNKYLKGLIDQVDHIISIKSAVNRSAFKGVDPEKIIRRQIAFKRYSDWKSKKERNGKLTHTIALYGTEAMAQEAGLSLEKYWNQIIKACCLDKKDPKKEYKIIFDKISDIAKKLNDLKIEKIHLEGPDADLWIEIGEKRLWQGGSGHNIPSFEIFTSPDWRKTEGWIRFNKPLYRLGNLITGIELNFKKGHVIKARAQNNEKLLKEIIKIEGGDKIGEFSLTDRRFSYIEKFMADNLYDENTGGSYGNTHIALGKSFSQCCEGDPVKIKKEDLKILGFNQSAVHCDIVSTSERRVTAFLKNKKEVIIYEDGEFKV